MHIDALGISNYRSFGHDVQRIGPFSNINLFIGQNNSGKSNILSFINSHYPIAIHSLTEGTRLSFGDLDRHLGEKNDHRVIELGFPIAGEKYQQLFNRITVSGREALERILGSQAIRLGTDVAWFRFIRMR
jgi:predicted ATPase